MLFRSRGYLMDNYQSRVLQPDMRHPRIAQGLETAFQEAHARFRATVDELDKRERAFIATHTRLLEAYPAGSVKVGLDWSAQKWRIPAHYAEDQAEKTYRSVAVMGTAVALGPFLRPVLARVGESIMGRVAVRTAQSRSGQIVGIITGHMSLSQIKQTGEGGRGLGLAGVIIGWVSLGLWILGIIAFVLFFVAVGTAGAFKLGDAGTGGRLSQIGWQLIGIGVTWVWSFVLTSIILLAIKATIEIGRAHV